MSNCVKGCSIRKAENCCSRGQVLKTGWSPGWGYWKAVELSKAGVEVIGGLVPGMIVGPHPLSSSCPFAHVSSSLLHVCLL